LGNITVGLLATAPQIRVTTMIKCGLRRIHEKSLEVSPWPIVQHWKEDNWKDFTTVTFRLDEAEGATTVKLVHEEIPDGSVKNIKSAWDQYYMLPLKELVEAQGRGDA
jgi:activator of HSP90 ATPase